MAAKERMTVQFESFRLRLAEESQRRRLRPASRRDALRPLPREFLRSGALLSEAAIDVPVSFPQRRLLHLAHCIARQRLDQDDLFGRFELGEATTER